MNYQNCYSYMCKNDNYSYLSKLQINGNPFTQIRHIKLLVKSFYDRYLFFNINLHANQTYVCNNLLAWKISYQLNTKY